MARKPGAGRQKIPMAKIQKRSHRDVTFSKRRSGLFKKASELTTLCGAEVGLIVFSPAGKAFSYGSPDVDTIIDRVMAGGEGGGGGGARESALAGHLNVHLAQVEERVAEEKKLGEELDKLPRAFEAEHGRCWWRDIENAPESTTLSELERLMKAMEDLKRHTVEHAQKLMIMEQAAATAVNTPFFYANYGAGTSSASPNAGLPLPPYPYQNYAAGYSSANPDHGPLPPVHGYGNYAAGSSSSANPKLGGPIPPNYAAGSSSANPPSSSSTSYGYGTSSAFLSTGGPSSANYGAGASSENHYGGSGGSGYGPQGPI